jgi:hypothetical protein
VKPQLCNPTDGNPAPARSANADIVKYDSLWNDFRQTAAVYLVVDDGGIRVVVLLKQQFAMSMLR